MDVYEALYTTRAMRRVKPDPVPMDVQARILDAAIRAPSGGNQQGWRFMLVDDPDLISKIAVVYRRSIDMLWESIYNERLDAANANPEAPESKAFHRMHASVEHAADNFSGYPLLLFGFIQHDPSGGSIYPAVWNAQLAARAEGVGSCLTSIMTFESQAVMDLLGVPEDDGWLMACCVTMGYPTGKWGVAPRRPVNEVSYRNAWGEPVGFVVDAPLWSAD